MKVPKLPLDLVLNDYINFCLEHQPVVQKMFSSGYSSTGSKLRAVFANIIYNESIHLTLSDVANCIGAKGRTSIQKYHDRHNHSIKQDDEYKKLYQEMLVLTQMYRSKKELASVGNVFSVESGAGWNKYENDVIAKCYKTGEPIRYGDFIGGTTQGGNQFTAIPLIEIGENILGVHNHKIKVPLKAHPDFDDVIILERLRLDQKSHLEWRYVI